MTGRLAVLASGSGTNAAAIVDRLHRDRDGADVACVVTDRPAAGVIELMRTRGIEVIVVPRRDGRVEHERRLVATLDAYGTDVVALAGYMRICGEVFLERFAGRTLNVHPSLLPAYPGKDAPGAALDDGAAVTGVTVHFIDEGVDTGPVVCQAPVRIEQGDTRALLQQRIQPVEHRLYPCCALALARGELVLDGPFVYASQRLADELAQYGVEIGQYHVPSETEVVLR